MIYLFEDREERKRQFLGDEFNHSLIRQKPFDCTDAKEIIEYIKSNYQDAVAVLLHKSYEFGNKGITLDSVKNGFQIALNVPVVLFSGGSNSNLIREGEAITAEINSGVMYQNLTCFLNEYQTNGMICIPLLVYGRNYRLNQLLEMQSKMYSYFFDRKDNDEITQTDKRQILKILRAVTDNGIIYDMTKLQKWIEERFANNNPIYISLLLNQIQNLINKYQ
jgi:hypothetical protein